MQATEGRILRSCDVCGQVDDHPRHVFDTTGADELVVNEEAVEAAYNTKGLGARDLVRIVQELQDVGSFQRHFDCCVEAGCPDGTCAEVLKRVKNSHGLEIVSALNEGDVA